MTLWLFGLSCSPETGGKVEEVEDDDDAVPELVDNFEVDG